MRVVFVILCVLLTACGGNLPRVDQGNDDGHGVQPDPADKAVSTSAPVKGDKLPGRLLFVQDGVIWVWQETQARPLIGSGEAWQPEWSADGTQIVYVERGESYSDVMVADASGAFIAQMTMNESEYPSQSHERINDTMWAFYPIWSPGGQRITVATQYGPPVGSPALEYALSIYTLSASGGARRQLYADDLAHCGSMTYMPHTSASKTVYELVFTRIDVRPDMPQHIYHIDLSNAAAVAAPFPGVPTASYDPAFSPDGTWLAFALRVDEQTDIWVVPGRVDEEATAIATATATAIATATAAATAAAAATVAATATAVATVPQRLTNLGKARAPVFSPDGSMLAFLAIPPGESGFELWVVDVHEEQGVLVAGEPRQVTEGMSLDGDSGLSWAE